MATDHQTTTSPISAELHRITLNAICTVLGRPISAIKLNASFPASGGDSLDAILLSSLCRKQGITLPIEIILQSRSIHFLLQNVSKQSLGDQPNNKAMLDTNSNDISHYESQNERPVKRQRLTQNESLLNVSSPLHLQLTPKEEDCILTEMQKSLIHGSRICPGANIISFFETYRTEDLATMKEAWKTVIAIEPIFRLHGSLHGTHINIKMDVEAPFLWNEVVTRHQKEYNAAVHEPPNHHAIGTSFKIVILDQGINGPSTATIIWHIHHALIDGWSASRVYQKVRQAAEGQRIHAGSPFLRVAKDLAAFHRSSRDVFKHFWAQERVEFPSTASEIILPPRQEVQYPTVFTPPRHTTEIATLELPLAQIIQFVQRHNCTTAALYYSAWALVLSKYTDSDRVMFGSVLSGRDLHVDGADDTIGPLINTLPFNVAINEEQFALEFIQGIFHRMIKLHNMQCSVPADGFSRNFSSAIARQQSFKYTPQTKIQPISDNSFRLISDVSISILINDNGNVQLCYHSDKYQHADMKTLCYYYQTFIATLIQPQKRLRDCLDVLHAPSYELLLNLGNCAPPTTSSTSIESDLVTLFEDAALKHPDSIALEKEGKFTTYEKLENDAHLIAQRLSNLIEPGECVCVHADRSINWIISIYGILKAGAVYAPLDPSLPAAIRDINFQTVKANVFLAPDADAQKCAPASCSHSLSVQDILRHDAPAEEVSAYPVTRRRAQANPSAPAYVCFTSGSTGTPKAVLCTHEGLVAFQRDEEVRLFANPGIRVAQTMSPAFDGSIHEIFSALSYGATLVLQDPAQPFQHLCSTHSAILTPSIAKVLSPSEYPMLQNVSWGGMLFLNNANHIQVYLVGEPVSQVVNDTWSELKALYNMYGPTEATCGATIKRLRVGIPVNLGHPNPSTRIYVLDRKARLLPPGVTGEIYLAGVQVAREYVGNTEETTKRFLHDPICAYLSERMYRTGDVGYWNAAGELVLLGRKDRQIKLRGFRLDLNDLEVRILRALPEATAAAVIRKDDYLIAVIQPASLADVNLRSRISQLLPPYALPRFIISRDYLPMTSTGKLDYTAIARDADISNELTQPTKALSTPTERMVADAWRECLDIDPNISIHSTSEFITLGGHSMLQFELANLLTRMFGRVIPAKLVLTSPTLRDLAQGIDQSLSRESSEPTTPSTPSDAGRHWVSCREYEWWLQYQVGLGTSSFNVPVVWSLDIHRVDRQRLRHAWNTVMARHRILRSRFIYERKGLQRRYSDLPPQARLVKKANIRKVVNRPFRPEQDDLIRVIISRTHMVVCISHIICDLTTLRVLWDEVQAAYAVKSLPPIDREYSEAPYWSSIDCQPNLSFWDEYLGGARSAPRTISSSSMRAGYIGTSHAVLLPSALFHGLTDFASTYGFTLHQVALAAVGLACSVSRKMTLCPEDPDIDLVIGSPYFNRQHTDLATIGLFLEPLPIRLRFTHDPGSSASALDFVRAAQKSSQLALAHVIPWVQLIQHLDLQSKYPQYPLFDTMVTFHDDRRNGSSWLGMEGCTPLLTWAEGAKFRLMCEFDALNEHCCLLRLEYDTQVFDKQEIVHMADIIFSAFDALIADMGYEDMRAHLESVAAQEHELHLGEQIAFGTAVASI